MNKNILVVEDNKEHSLLMQKILIRYGYTIDIVEDGKAAIAYCKSHTPPFLILMDIMLPDIMDIMLPDINGLDLTGKIKQFPRYKNVPVVAVTIQSSKIMEKEVIEAGCANLLFKPYLPAELVKMVEQYKK